MIEIQSNQGDELTPEQKATLDAIAAEQATEVKPKEVKPEEVKPVVEEVKPTPEPEKVMPDPDEDVDEGEQTDSRQPKFVRLEKHLKIRDKVKELEEELMALKSKPTTQSNEAQQIAVTDEIAAYAEENGYDAEQTKKLVEIIEKSAAGRIEKQFADKFNQLNEVAEKAKRENEEVTQEKIWNKQYNELVEQFGSEKDHIETIKDSIKKLAYSKEFHQAPLAAVYAYLKEVQGLKPTTGSKTVESGTGGSNNGGIDFASILANNDQEAIRNMSSEDFNELQKFIKSNNL